MTLYDKDGKIIGFQVPNHGEAPTDEEVDWLHEWCSVNAEHGWDFDGDDSGVVVHHGEEYWMGFPGDFVVVVGNEMKVFTQKPKFV